MRDPFDYPLESMTSQQRQREQKERDAQQSWSISVQVILLAALVIFGAILFWTGRDSQKTLGGDEGILRDGVYYVYGGGGLALPDEVKTPIGLCAYTPGQEPEVLVSSKDYRLDTIFPCWDINSHGLYFSDRATASLYRMDLKTREIIDLYRLPDAPKGESPYIFLNGLWEDRIALVCYDGFHDYHVVLDCRTGEVLSKEKDDQGQNWNLVAGERTLVQYQMNFPIGTEYPGWERDVADGVYYYNDLRENGVSVLPQGHQLEEYESRAIGDAILVVSHPFEDRGNWTSQLFLEDGTTRELPKDREGTYYRYLAVSDQWLFYYISGDKNALMAMDLETGESYEVSPTYIYFAVTDGNWFYSYGDYTNCYQLEYDDQGIPCGLTLIESNI